MIALFTGLRGLFRPREVERPCSKGRLVLPITTRGLSVIRAAGANRCCAMRRVHCEGGGSRAAKGIGAALEGTGW